MRCETKLSVRRRHAQECHGATGARSAMHESGGHIAAVSSSRCHRCGSIAAVPSPRFQRRTRDEAGDDEARVDARVGFHDGAVDEKPDGAHREDAREVREDVGENVRHRVAVGALQVVLHVRRRREVVAVEQTRHERHRNAREAFRRCGDGDAHPFSQPSARSRNDGRGVLSGKRAGTAERYAADQSSHSFLCVSLEHTARCRRKAHTTPRATTRATPPIGTRRDTTAHHSARRHRLEASRPGAPAQASSH